MRRGVAAVALAALLILSGCSGFLGSTNSTATTTVNNTTTTSFQLSVGGVTPTEQPSTLTTPRRTLQEVNTIQGTPTDRPEVTVTTALPQSDYAPGVYENELDVPRLALAHAKQRNASAFAERLTVDDGSGDPTMVKVRRENGTVHLESSVDGLETEQYLTADTSAQYRASSDQVRYNSGEIGNDRIRLNHALQRSFVPAPYLLLGQWSVNDTIEQNGNSYNLVRVTGPNQTGYRRLQRASKFGIGTPSEQLRAISGFALVTDQGLIRQIKLRARLFNTDNGALSNVKIDYVVNRTDRVDVVRPRWMDRVPRVTTELSDDGKIIEIWNSGGRGISRNSQIEVYAAEQRVGEITVSERISPGERVYVYATEVAGEGGIREETMDFKIAYGARPSESQELIRFSDRLTGDPIVITGASGQSTFTSGVTFHDEASVGPTDSEQGTPSGGPIVQTSSPSDTTETGPGGGF
jgi:hypothetical protein